MQADGLATAVYGGIEGPILQMQFILADSKANAQQHKCVYTEWGKKSQKIWVTIIINAGAGDHFGPDTSTLTPDSLWSGYNDGSVC